MQKNILFICGFLFIFLNASYTQNTYSKEIKSSNDVFFYGLIATKSLQSTVLATSDPSASFGKNVFFSKFDDKGTLKWSKVFTYNNADGLNIAATKNEGFVGIAESDNGDGGIMYEVDSNGNVAWAKQLQLNSDDVAYASGIASTEDGTIYTENYTSAGAAIQQFDEKGNLIWNRYILIGNKKGVLGDLVLLKPAADNGVLADFLSTDNGVNTNYLFKISKSGKAEWAFKTNAGINFPGLLAADTRADGQADIISYANGNYIYSLLDPYTGKSRSYRIGPTIFDVQAYARKDNLRALIGSSFGYQLYFGDVFVFTKDFSFTQAVRYQYADLRYSTKMYKYDSAGRICPGYVRPVLNDTAVRINFGFNKFSFTVDSTLGSFSIINTTLPGQTKYNLINVCDGVAPALKNATSQKSNAGIIDNIIIFPNPVVSRATLSLTSNQGGMVTFTIISKEGIVKNSFSRIVAKGGNSIECDVSMLTAGVYIIKAVGAGTNISVKVFKQ